MVKCEAHESLKYYLHQSWRDSSYQPSFLLFSIAYRMRNEKKRGARPNISRSSIRAASKSCRLTWLGTKLPASMTIQLKQQKSWRKSTHWKMLLTRPSIAIYPSTAVCLEEAHGETAVTNDDRRTWRGGVLAFNEALSTIKRVANSWRQRK